MATNQQADHNYGTLDDARAVLQRYFGYPDFRAPQLPAVEAVLSGRDALLLLPTGGGKSICYQVPALARKGLTVVLSPLISLMKDQVEALERRGIHAAYINSTISASDVASRMAEAADGSLRMLYLAPEKLDSPKMLQRIQNIGVSLLAIDEAHCISEWGHEFRPSYRRIGAIRDALGSPQAVALTATATPHVRHDIVHQLRLVNPNIIVGGFDRTNLIYHVIPARNQHEKDHIAINLLRHADGTSVVYAPTRKAVERVASTLVRGRIRAIAYHGGLEAGERQRAQDAFMNEQARVIVATSAFGMGIDKPNVRLVIHHAMSGTLEAYYQEAGRAGRDGNTSTCVLLHNHADRLTHEFFIHGTHPGRAIIEATWQALRASATSNATSPTTSKTTSNTTSTLAPLTIDALAASVRPRTDARQVHAALRVLITAGLVRPERPSPTQVWLRLLATPRRIAQELTGDREIDRIVLRAIWQQVGERLHDGVLVDLARLPRQLGSSAVVPILERLESHQFVVCERTGGGFRLDPRCRDPEWLPIDWHALDKRRRSELARLDAMQKYAVTRACRRAFVLRYFGDPDAKPHCGACDRCLGTTAELLMRSTIPPSSSSHVRRHS